MDLESTHTPKTSAPDSNTSVNSLDFCIYSYAVTIDRVPVSLGGGFFFVVTAGSYLLANLGASLLTAARQGWKYLPLLPLVFASLHLSYGLGFLAGLFKFWNRWGHHGKTTPVRVGDTSG